MRALGGGAVNSFDPIEPHGILHGISARSVIRGFLWDNFLSIVFSLLLAHNSLPNGLFESNESEVDAVFASAAFNLLFLPIGLGCTGFGAYLAAMRCAGAESANAVAVGVASLLLGMACLLLLPGGQPPLWITLVGWILILPAAAAGGAIASARKRADA
jgi:hypothetical protein